MTVRAVLPEGEVSAVVSPVEQEKKVNAHKSAVTTDVKCFIHNLHIAFSPIFRQFKKNERVIFSERCLFFRNGEIEYIISGSMGIRLNPPLCTD